MGAFFEFLSSLDPDPGKRGKQFEHFVKWFLKNDPEWSTQVDQVWLWDEYPDSWGRDCGIDLVFKHKNGENWAVQAKCYAPTTQITKADVDSFISESNRDGIDKRLLIATTDLIGANAKQVCDAQDKPVTRFLLSHFEDADIEYPVTLDDLPKAKRKDKPKPRDHQIEAIEAVASNFKDVDRGQLIMACGTGKTFTTLWIKERLGVESTLVLLPSLGLLSQTLHEWTLAANEEFQVLCVCSDESVGKKGSDEAVHSIADLAFPVTSNASAIKAFLNSSGKKVIFSTYQSSPLIAEAQSDKAVPAFDLAVADEAHRCAGKVSGDFSTILDGEKIRAKKRLFTTATPRTYSSSVKKAAEDRGVEVVGMDDEAVFGKQLFALNFGEAIKRGLLTDYRVVIIGVDDPTISAWIENRELLKADSDIEMDAETLAAQVGLLKAIKDYDLHRLISFHSRVSRAEDFSQNIHKVFSWIDEKHKPSGELKSDFVSGEMPTDKRRRKLAQLKGLKDNQRGLLTNARCLSEGVDVPSLDGVAFIDPRSSQIDIIQAVGRAIRLSEKKKAGTIVLPVFISNGDDPEQALEEGNFKPIWDVLNALKAHDDVLADELNQLRTNMGVRATNNSSTQFSKIDIDIPLSVDKLFTETFSTLVVENSTSSWEYWFGLLISYGHKFGNYQVPLAYETQGGKKLGSWVRNQRSNFDQISTYRREKLESLDGWTWKAKEWLPFEEAREFVRNLGLKSAKEWQKFALSKNMPENIPTTPPKAYKDCGWISYADWLGTDYISTSKRNILPFEEARKTVRGFNLKSIKEWKDFSKKGLKPLNIPLIPERSYANSGWAGYGDWLGIESRRRRDSSLWLPFDEARTYVRSLNLTTSIDWYEFTKTKSFPEFLPIQPDDYYFGSGWQGFTDFLNFPAKKMPYTEARNLAIQTCKELGITSMDQWVKLGQEGKLPHDLPTRPERYYANEWINWFDWFGKNNTRDKEYLPFKEARAYVRSLNLKTVKEWNAYLKRKIKPDNIPYHPERTYKEEGWEGWKDWLKEP
jgi:superfamily II DNA or RNA helicase